MKTAILVDGGFYRRRAQARLGAQTPQERADELFSYCLKHLHQRRNPSHGKDKSKGHESIAELYRIFYYDCPPMRRQVYHPLLRRTIDFSRTPLLRWTEDFYDALKQKRKVALRLGKLADEQAHYNLRPDILKKVLSGSRSISDLTENDFSLSVEQKGVDMKIGLDIASLAFKKQVDQIVLISGDSDFVPAAKLARREGIDFVLDPLFNPIKPDLWEHIDGLRTCDSRFNPNRETEAEHP